MLIVVTVAACGATGDDGSSIEDLEVVTAAEFETHLSQLARPAVVNVWASWCLPCRSEAPLLDRAHAEFGDEIEFIGVAVQDSQASAKQFLAEFGLEFDQFFDENRSVPNAYGGFGVPITMFFGADGELVTIHNGVIDERTLALGIDELIQGS